MEDLAAVSLARDEPFDATRRYGVAEASVAARDVRFEPARRRFMTSLESGCRAGVGPRFAELEVVAEDVPFAAEVSSVQAGAAP